MFERQGEVEDLAGVNFAGEHVGDPCFEVVADWCGAAGQTGVFAEEGAESDGCFFVLGNPNPGDDAAGADHAYRLVVGGHVAYGFEYHVGAVAAGEVHDLGDAGFATFGHHVGGPEFAAQVGAVFVPAHEDDAFGAEGFGGEYRGEADGAVADDGDDFAGGDFAHVGGVVAGEVDVGKREQGGEQFVAGGVGVDVGDFHHGAVGEGDAGVLGLESAGVGLAVEAAVDAGGLHAFLAVDAGVVLVGEWDDDEVAGPDGGDVAADFFHDGDEFVAHGVAGVVAGHVVVGVQVGAAHAGADRAHDGVGGVFDGGFGNVGDAHITGTEHEGGFHWWTFH